MPYLSRRDFVVLSSLGFVGALGNRLVFAQAPAGAAQPPTVPESRSRCAPWPLSGSRPQK